MIVLLLGSGGREHALARALAADPDVTALHFAPGNPGTAELGENHAFDQSSPAQVAEAAVQLRADLVVVGPEAPLVAGVADAVRAAGVACFGPGAAAARLEGSKAFAKQVMVAAGVPTAGHVVARDAAGVARALDQFGPPHVVKDDGLAAGKGVVVTNDREAALAHAASCGQVVVEEYLDGPEVSLFAICDGVDAVALAPAQDFKRALDGDAGPNTGGMGAYSPLPWADEGLAEQVMAQVVRPTMWEMSRRGTPFRGLLYVGLALTSNGLRVVEFNVRFGDPETQSVLARLKTPLGRLLELAATGRLAEAGPLEWSDQAAVTVVMAADGYPGVPARGGRVVLPPDAPDAYALHAGTAWRDGHLVSAGGRVVDVVGLGVDVPAARRAAYAHVARVDFPDGFYRTDIAAKA